MRRADLDRSARRRAAVAGLLVLGLGVIARAETKTAATYHDASWGFSLDVPAFDGVEASGRLAEFIEIGRRGEARTLLRVIARKPTTAKAERDHLVAGFAKPGHRLVSEKTSKIGEREAVIVEYEGKDQGADARFTTTIVVDKACTLLLTCQSAAASREANEKALRDAVESLSFVASAPVGAGTRYRHEGLGFSIVPPAFARRTIDEPSAIFVGGAGDQKTRVVVTLRKNTYASAKALRDFIVPAYEKTGAKVGAERTTTVGGRDALELDLTEKDDRRLALHVLAAEAVYVVAAYCPASDFAAREGHLRAALASFRLDRVESGPPSLAAPFVARPSFTVGGEESSAGHAFAVRWGDEKRLLVLT
ncbi:MAG: hypothetical protein ACAI25_10240, partial [Planctomycetota bacterium]